MRALILPLALAAAPLAAQDLQPALDPVQIAQGQVLAGTMRGHADRDARRLGYRDVDAYKSARTCRNARRMARPAGARGVAMDRLRALCRQGGY